MRMKTFYILLVLLCNSIVASEKQFFVRCSDGSLFINKEVLEALPGLHIGPSHIKKPQFPRYCVQNNEYVECSWIPTMAYMKELTDFFVFDHRKLKKRFPLKTFTELCVMYHDYAYLCINDTSSIEQSLIKQFYREHNSKKEHWTFIIQYFSSKRPNLFFDFTKSKSPTRDTMIEYWLSRMNEYKGKYMLCSHQNGTDFFIFNNDLYEKLNAIIRNFYCFFYAEFRAFKRKIYGGVLDLSDFELTDDVLYSHANDGLNEVFFGHMLGKPYPVNFNVTTLILDNNKITKLPLEMFIKWFPNMQTLSVKNCPINQMPSENDYAIFNYKRSDYLITIPPEKTICESMRQYYNRETLMWDSRNSLVDGYNYDNDNKPLTVITDNDFVLESYSKVDCTKLILKKESKKPDELSKKKSNNTVNYHKNMFLYAISFTGFNVLLCWITWKSFMSKNYHPLSV